MSSSSASQPAGSQQPPRRHSHLAEREAASHGNKGSISSINGGGGGGGGGAAADAPSSATTTMSTGGGGRRVLRGRGRGRQPPAATTAAADSTVAADASDTGLPAAAAGRKRAAGKVAAEAPCGGGLDEPRAAAAKRPRPPPELTGWLDKLPPELVNTILELCGPRQLACLLTTCRFWTRTVRSLAEARLRAVPRAKGIEPVAAAGESYPMLLNFILGQAGAAAQATAVALGGHHSAMLLIAEGGDTDGASAGSKGDGDGIRRHSLFTCGRGFQGQLGRGDFEPTADPKPLCLGFLPCPDDARLEEEVTPAVVAAGCEHTVSITRRGHLMTWGVASHGELGHVEGESSIAAPVPARASLFGRPNTRIVSVACGASHTLAIGESGGVYACGLNSSCQLGNGTFDNSDALRPVVGTKGFRIVAAAAGAMHSMALASDGSLFTWGSGNYGQLGLIGLQAAHLHAPQQLVVGPVAQKVTALDPRALPPAQRVTSIAAGAHHSAAVTVGGTLLTCGRNHHGQTGLGDAAAAGAAAGCCWAFAAVRFACGADADPAAFRVVQVACGAQHSLALVSHRGRVGPFAAGANSFGQLGLGGGGHQQLHEARRFQPIAALWRARVAAVQAGAFSSCAVGEGGEVYVWGRNDSGSLGLGHCVSPSEPELLVGLRAVHPDMTLRKSKRPAPRMRPAASPGGSARLPPPPCAPALAALLAGAGKRAAAGQALTTAAAPVPTAAAAATTTEEEEEHKAADVSKDAVAKPHAAAAAAAAKRDGGGGGGLSGGRGGAAKVAVEEDGGRDDVRDAA